jgi:hypothetical protein
MRNPALKQSHLKTITGTWKLRKTTARKKNQLRIYEN